MMARLAKARESQPYSVEWSQMDDATLQLRTKRQWLGSSEPAVSWRVMGLSGGAEPSLEKLSVTPMRAVLLAAWRVA
jgi:hypothetical protein